jgi:hypothetical protein
MMKNLFKTTFGFLKTGIYNQIIMEKIFNLSRYKELINREKNGEISFLDLELLSYKASVSQQISYTRKKDYFTLIDGYLSGIITNYNFLYKFLQMKK